MQYPEHSLHYFKTTFPLIALLICLAGCASLPTDSPGKSSIPKGESLVFGAIVLGPAQTTSLHGFAGDTVVLIDTRTSKVIFEHRIGGFWRLTHIGPGQYPFCWALPPGQYAILKLNEHFEYGTMMLSRRVFAQFSVDSDRQAIYLGTLHLETNLSFVSDDSDIAIKTFHDDYPDIHAEPVKNLMQIGETR